MKKKPLLLLIAITALLTVGITLAYMFRQTAPIKNEFTEANVACSVQETFDGTQKTSIKVKNDSNIDCYLRVRLVSYWQNAQGPQGQIVGKPSVIPELSFEDGWIPDSENATYYYTNPVKAGQTSGELLKAPLTLAGETWNGKTVYQVVNVFAEAIQAEPKEAVEAAWPFLDRFLNPAGE